MSRLLGAHVSTAGGIDRAPARATTIGATAMQVFTKSPNQWRDPFPSGARIASFREAVQASRIDAVVAHDSYLINLASPDRPMRDRSITSFIAELQRCRALGIAWVVSHPGNYLDDPERGLDRNAEAYGAALDTVDGPMILIESTAGAGTALGSTFEELATLHRRIPRRHRSRVGFCADTCHLFSAGYDLVDAYDAVWNHWDSTIGLEHLRCLHLNDSKTPFASKRDRHAPIAEGSLGAAPFRRIMRDPRFDRVIKIIETPKGDDPVRNDRRMLRRLRSYQTRG